MSAEEQLEAWVREAVDLRYGAAGDPEGRLPDDPGQHPDEIIHTLTRVRIRADRVEEILTRVRRLKGRLSRQMQDAQFEAEIKRDEAFQANRASKVQDYMSKEEKAADAALDSIQEKRAAHSAKRVADAAAEAYDVVGEAKWGLSAYRQDLRSILHALTTISNVEYSGKQ